MAKRTVRSNPSGYVSCDGFDAVMRFVANAMEYNYPTEREVNVLWINLAQAAAKDHGVKTPRASKWMDCEWLIKKLQAMTPEAQWDLVLRVEPLFHSAWETSSSASQMMKCAGQLYPARQDLPLISNNDLRLTACDIAETLLLYTTDVSNSRSTIKTSRDYALNRATFNDLRKAHKAAWDIANRSSMYADRTVAFCARADDVTATAWAAATAISNASSSPRESYYTAEARNADIVRKSLGTPGLALLMR